jgi:hypothetical protein
MNYIKNLINNELANLGANEEYWGTEENINNENTVYDFFLNENIVDQDWFDNRLQYASEERLEELYQLL